MFRGFSAAVSPEARCRHDRRTWIGKTALVAALSLAFFPRVVAAPAKSASSAAKSTFVVASASFSQAEEHMSANADGFVRRIEQVAKLPSGTFSVKALSKPRDALALIRDSKAGLALLPAHQFVAGRKEFKFEIVARAVGVLGTSIAYHALMKKGKRRFDQIENQPGLRLATTDVRDSQWLVVLFEAAVDPLRHFQLLEVDSDKAALELVRTDKADVAMVYEPTVRSLQPPLDRDDREFDAVYSSAGVQAPVLVATKFLSPALKKKLMAGVQLTCRDDGGPACSRVDVMYLQTDQADKYRHIITKYDTYKPY